MLMSLGDDLLFLIFEFAIVSIVSCKDYRSVCQRCKALLIGNHCHAKLRDVWAEDFFWNALIQMERVPAWRERELIKSIIPCWITRGNVNILCIYSSDREQFRPGSFAKCLERVKCVTRLSYERVYSLGHRDPYRLYLGVNKSLNKRRAQLWFKYQIQNDGFPVLLLLMYKCMYKVKDLAKMCSSFYVFGRPLPIICLMRKKPDESLNQFFKDHNLTVDYLLL